MKPASYANLDLTLNQKPVALVHWKMGRVKDASLKTEFKSFKNN